MNASQRSTTGRFRLGIPALAGLVALICGGLLVLYATYLHPWMMNWGSTPAEQAMLLPGDEALPRGTVFHTRAITVQAPSATVWAWLIQHGQDRAGFYSNDYLENLLGADIHNGDRLVPDWQDRVVGDRIPMARPDIALGAAGDSLYLRIQAMEPGRMLTTVDGNNLPARWFLVPVDANTTRVLVRELSFAPVMGETFTTWVWDPVHFVMESRMMSGIKERAEGSPLVPGWLSLLARVGWLATGLAIAVAFVAGRSRGWIAAGLLCVALMVPSVSSGNDLNSGLAGFLAMGISLVGLRLWRLRWVIAYPMVAASVLLVLLLAPDSWTAFGLIFDLLAVGIGYQLYAARRAGSASAQGRIARYAI